MSTHIKSTFNQFSYINKRNFILYVRYASEIDNIHLVSYNYLPVKTYFLILLRQDMPNKSGIRPPAGHYYTFYIPFHFLESLYNDQFMGVIYYLQCEIYIQYISVLSLISCLIHILQNPVSFKSLSIYNNQGEEKCPS